MNTIKHIFKTTSGVYMIRNTITQKIYIGSAVNVSARISHHKLSLKKQCHDNANLQKEWNDYGSGSFEFFVLEYTEGENRPLEREQYYIDKFLEDGESLYNISRSAYGNIGLPQSDIQKKKSKETRSKWDKERQKTFVEKCRSLWTPERRKTKSEEMKAYREKRRGDFVYRFINPSGELIEIAKLKQFCQQNGLDTSRMLKVHKGVYGMKSHKGYTKA